jgi:hypothetical protein
MGRPRLTNTEKLLRAIARNDGMTRKEMVKFLLRLEGKKYVPTENRDTYNALIYGTSRRQGITERFCQRDTDEPTRFVVTEPIEAPFTPLR